MREPLPTRRESMVIPFIHRGIKHYATVSFYPDGRLGEAFLKAGKVGSALEASARDIAVAASFAFQYGCPAGELRAALTRDDDGSAAGPLGELLDLVAKECRI